MGINKSYIHIDEAFSLGLSNYEKVKFQLTDGFYNNWHNKEYYEDYLVVNEDEKFDFTPVYENQKNDVHPPFYYLLLRIAMSFHIGYFSKWSGLILNMIIYAFITIFMYLIAKKLLDGKKYFIEKSIIIAFISSITIASITNALYIRMYALSTLNVVIITYLHLKLLDCEKTDYKLLAEISISALIGSLTHYYYLFYLAMLFIMFTVKYLRQKQYKEFGRYFACLAIAGILSILIFPYSIKHMFFGYRGKGAISNLSHISEFLKSIVTYVSKINRYNFNNLLFFILISIVGVIIYKKSQKIKLIESQNKYLKYLILPSLLYFVLVALSAPWKEIRYVLPICGIIFIIVFYYLYELLSNIVNEKVLHIIFLSVFTIMLIMPIVADIKISILYTEQKEIVSKVKNEYNNIPTVYWTRGKNVRFQDDILLFTFIEQSYVAEGIECNEETIKNIMTGKELNNGMMVFIQEGQDNNAILETMKSAMNLQEIKHIKRMNACDIYIIK